jgi:hypothetical protein
MDHRTESRNIPRIEITGYKGKNLSQQIKQERSGAWVVGRKGVCWRVWGLAATRETSVVHTRLDQNTPLSCVFRYVEILLFFSLSLSLPYYFIFFFYLYLVFMHCACLLEDERLV